jgi:anti-repressor protein
LMHVSKLYTATEIAKELGMRSAQELNIELEKRHIQYFQNGTWIPHADYSDCGYFSIKQQVLDNGKVVYDRKITQDGRAFILLNLKTWVQHR